MSTLFVNKLKAAVGSVINVPTGQELHAPGHVIQVKSTIVTSKVTATGTNTNSGTGADMGLNVTITPKRTGSHFLIQCHVGVASTTSGNTYAAVLSRSGTRIGVGDTVSSRLGIWFRGPDHAGNNGSDTNHGVGNGGVYYDTTANAVAGTAITYKVGFHGENGQVQINHVESSYSGTSYPVEALTSSSLIVQEIAQ